MNAFLRVIPAILLLMLAGCQKEIDDSCTLSGTSMAGNYRVVSYKEDGVELINDQTVFEPCELDNIVSINAGGIYEVTEGLNVCDPSKGYSGTWTLSGNTFYWDHDDYLVKDFNCKGFTLSYSYTDPQDPALTYSEEITLERL